VNEPAPGRRVIQVNQQVAAAAEPRLRNVRPTRLSDYPGVAQVYLDMAQRLSSPLMMGPPICDELIAFVCHLFTEEEAGAARHLGMFRGRSAEQVARAEHRPLDQVAPVLDHLAFEKRAISCSGDGEKRRYRLMAIMPGIFEMVLISQSPETITDWHRRFAELFEALYETGYMADFANPRATPFVRVFPVGQAIAAHPMALPTDKLEIVLDRFEVFGVGQCQCRTTQQVVGRGCGKPVGNCMVMGQWAERGVRDGWLRQVTKQEALDIKREAESHGMVNWMMNVESTKGQCSCSCCGCCCHAMRSITQFNVPGMFAPPHFLPKLDAAKCSHCGLCARRCPLGAIVVDTAAKTWRHKTERCVGCGQCALACQQKHAILMEPVPDYRLPYKSWFALLSRAVPGMLKTSWKVWRQRG
jgi:Na+-translocating ferredoxin:NAD+ oxidoreductase subunit B